MHRGRALAHDAFPTRETEAARAAERRVERREARPCRARVELGALRRQESLITSSYPCNAAPCSAVWPSLAWRVDVEAAVEQQLNRLDRLLLRLVAAGRVFLRRAESRGGHQRVDAAARGRERRIGAVLEQQLHGGRSPAFAARRNGVVPAPSIVSLPRSSLARYGGKRFSGAFGSAPRSSSMRATSSAVNEFSSTFGAGRFELSIVLKSIAAYSAAAARVVDEIRIGAGFDQRARDVVVAVDQRQDRPR